MKWYLLLFPLFCIPFFFGHMQFTKSKYTGRLRNWLTKPCFKPVSLANKNVLQLLTKSLDPVELDRIIFQNNFNVRKEKQLIDLLNILNSTELKN